MTDALRDRLNSIRTAVNSWIAQHGGTNPPAYARQEDFGGKSMSIVLYGRISVDLNDSLLFSELRTLLKDSGCEEVLIYPGYVRNGRLPVLIGATLRAEES